MRLFIAACVLAFGLPGLALAQDKPTPTTKPTHGGNGGSIIKNHDTRGSGPGGAGAALKGNNSQPSDRNAGQPPAAGSKQ